MSKPVFHISDVKRYYRCPTLFSYSVTEKNKPSPSFLRLDETLTDLASKKLQVPSDAFHGVRGDDPQRAMEALQTEEWLVKARFEYDGLRIKIPFLHKHQDVFDVYFLFCGISPKGDDSLFYALNIWVLKSLGIPLGRIRLLYFDGNYIRKDDLNCHQLFKMSAVFTSGDGKMRESIAHNVRRRMKDFSVTLEAMRALAQNPVIEPVRASRCTRGTKCAYYDRCFPQETTASDNSILNLVSSQYRYPMYEDGIERLQDADLERLEGLRLQYAQIQADRNGGLFFDRYALETWMQGCSYPLIFIDFEWETYAVPPYKGMHPFSVLPFEYSIHILSEDGTLTHSEFLGVGDCRRKMAERLLQDIPKEGTLIAFNAEGAEKIRIRELASRFPDLGKELLAVNKRMKDLALPFSTGIVYDTRMRGLYSLKVLMNMLSTQGGYADLEIHQGMQAVFEWRKWDRGETEDEGQSVAEHLKAYCGMDTYSMVVVWRWLHSLLK